MKISELSRELGVTPRDVIDFLKGEGHTEIHSHMQKVDNDIVELVREHFASQTKEVVKEVVSESIKEVKPKLEPPKKIARQINPEEMIPCRSVCSGKLVAVGVDGRTVYQWENFGDTEYVAYRDLQAMRKKPYVTKPLFLIEDPDICDAWRREIGEAYSPFIGVDYPEELLEIPDDKFAEMLKTGTDMFREVVQVTCMNMIRNQNYPTLQKINLIDEIMGTCIKEFL